MLFKKEKIIGGIIFKRIITEEYNICTKYCFGLDNCPEHIRTKCNEIYYDRQYYDHVLYIYDKEKNKNIC